MKVDPNHRRSYPDLFFDSHKEAEAKIPQLGDEVQPWVDAGKPHIWIKTDEVEHLGHTYTFYEDRGHGYILLAKDDVEIMCEGSSWGSSHGSNELVPYNEPVVCICGGYYGLPGERGRIYILPNGHDEEPG